MLLYEFLLELILCGLDLNAATSMHKDPESAVSQ